MTMTSKFQTGLEKVFQARVQDLIQCMMDHGWRELESGEVRHDDLDKTFPDWYSAMKACIEVASN
jgi:hypothetical protein